MSPPNRSRRRALALALLAPAVLSARLRAEAIAVRHTEARLDDEGVFIDVNFELVFNTTLEDALQRGVPLYFVLDTAVSRTRALWRDEIVTSETQQFRLIWAPLTRHFRLTSGLLTQTFPNLEAVSRTLARLRGRKVAERGLLRKGERYTVIVRLYHDLTQLPKPIQVSALTSKDWTLDSEDVRITLSTP